MSRVILILQILFLMAGCTSNDHAEEVKRMYRKQISLGIVSDDSLQVGPKVVVYHDSDQCSTCQLGHISDWDEIIWHLDSLRPSIPVLFIITPPEGRVREVTGYLHNLKLDRYHITVDSLNLFGKHNSMIPDNSLLHTFFLDRDNCVVLVGSPLFNKKLWDIYKDTARKMNDNDGLLPK